MSMIGVDYGVLNQKGSPSWFSDIYANIPTAGYKGRMFISIDTYAFYRDTGTGWDLIGGPGTGTITGSGTSGQVSYFNGSSTLAGSNNLFWDITNSRLGIGTTTPGVSLDIHSTGTNAQFNGTGTNNAYLVFQNAGSNKWRIGNTYNAGANSFDIYNNGLTTNAISISSTTNNAIFTGLIGVGTGATTPPAAITSYSASAGTQFKAVGTAPAITFSDTLTSPPYNCAIGMATAFSNFITGANIGDLCITNQTSPTRAIIFGLGTTEKARISPGGYFLLGTSTESSFLFDCNGQGRFQNILTLGSTLSNGTYFYTLPSATGTLALTSSLSSYLPLTGGTLTGQLYINPTNTATTGLDVASNNTSFRSDNLEGFKRQLLITMGSGTLVSLTAKGYGANYGTDMAFYTATTGGTNASPGIYITGTNNRVGIKTGTPTTDLDVSGTANVSGILTMGSNSQVLGTGTLKLGIASSNSGAGLQFLGWQTAGTNWLIDTAQTAGYGLCFTPSTTAGGSTFTTPTMTLLGTSVLIGQLTASGSTPGIYLRTGIESGFIVTNDNALQLSRYSSNGDIETFYRDATKVGSISVTTLATTYNVSGSDLRLKKNINNWDENVCELFKNINPKLFNFNFQNDNDEKIKGFIAQDMIDKFPEAYPIGDDGYYNYNPSGYVVYLVKAIQELNEKLVRNNIN